MFKHIHMYVRAIPDGGVLFLMVQIFATDKCCILYVSFTHLKDLKYMYKYTNRYIHEYLIFLKALLAALECEVCLFSTERLI